MKQLELLQQLLYIAGLIVNVLLVYYFVKWLKH